MTTANPTHRSLEMQRLAFALKWIASVIQIAGYSATAFGWTPMNLYLFLAGLTGWLAVGVLWNDRAIMLIHLVALGAMVAGMLGS
ncbi:MAG: ubiquinone biosynthesis methyltransferase UbiE [Rhodobacteraceae bacterium]|nr:ubiquinone biosynthesis methyltransferase UbiE [Paracoccaceae bacterium]